MHRDVTDDRPLVPDSQHRHLDPPNSNPSDRQDIPVHILDEPVGSREVPQPSNTGAVNDIDSKTPRY